MKTAAELLETLGDVKDALAAEFTATARQHSQHLNPMLVWISRFIGYQKKFSKAAGCYLYDCDGAKYLDLIGGFGALNLGHEPPEVLEALRLIEGRPNLLQTYLNPLAGKLAEYLAELTGKQLSRAFFCNSGAEACEAAIKLARIATGKAGLVYATGAYHGKTLGALSVSGREKYKKYFRPLIPDVHEIPYDNPGALEEVLRKREIAAFIVEPVQGEAGVIVPRPGYLSLARDLCRRYGALLIADEVQTGFGRTGKFFCFEHEGVCPDILMLSKALGGGVMPIGAILTSDKIWKKAYGTLETSLLHTSTFGGNARACACGIASIRSLLKKDLPSEADRTGRYLLLKLLEIKGRYSLLRDVRGKGLMIGMTLARLKGKKSMTEGALALWIARYMFRHHRMLMAFTLNNQDVLRLTPPLILSNAEADGFLSAFDEALRSAEKFAKFKLVEEG
ncbi:MAG: aspartate aminotransferase family protein [Candidatus Omnitrophota bacterium]